MGSYLLTKIRESATFFVASTMIICIECSAKTKDELDDLLRVGGYRDYSEAVALSVSNQLLLHQDAKTCSSGANVTTLKKREGSDQKVVESNGVVPPIISGGSRGHRVPVVLPHLFRMVRNESRQSNTVDLPDDPFEKGQRITIDRWIFGQHNKLLPLKASVRALAALSSENGGGVSLSKAVKEIAIASESLGTYLRALDEAFGLIREGSLSTAFPSPAADINKSRVRFTHQFVGASNKHGQLRGFPTDLKLVNYRNGKDPMLLLTEAGLTFASLVNPILDLPTDSANVYEKLSAEEKAFLIEHVRHNVPVEDFAMRTVLDAIASGARNPVDLDTALKDYLPNRSDKPFSSAFLSTQRAGVISRMSDLGLVDRIRDGVRVTYQVSVRGSQYLQQEVLVND